MLGLRRVRLGILIGLLGFVSSAAYAADDVSQLTQQLNACRQDVIDYRQAGSDADEMLAEARAGKLLVIGVMTGYIAVDPQTFTKMLMLRWADGEFTKEQLQEQVRGIAVMSKGAVETLTKMKAAAVEAQNERENECGALAERLKAATSTSGGTTAGSQEPGTATVVLKVLDRTETVNLTLNKDNYKIENPQRPDTTAQVRVDQPVEATASFTHNSSGWAIWLGVDADANTKQGATLCTSDTNCMVTSGPYPGVRRGYGKGWAAQEAVEVWLCPSQTSCVGKTNPVALININWVP